MSEKEEKRGVWLAYWPFMKECVWRREMTQADAQALWERCEKRRLNNLRLLTFLEWGGFSSGSEISDPDDLASDSDVADVN